MIPGFLLADECKTMPPLCPVLPRNDAPRRPQAVRVTVRTTTHLREAVETHCAGDGERGDSRNTT